MTLQREYTVKKLRHCQSIGI